MPAISVVIPVYNAEKYLRQCIGSVLSQSFKDFELILIDDGSTDGSSDICRACMAGDSRVRYERQENGGVSSARNRGIELATGRWLTFIDSDDWVENDYLQTLFDAACTDESLEWITSGIKYRFCNDVCKVERPERFGIFKTGEEDGFFAIATQKLVTSPVAKLYLLEIVRNYKIRFDTSLSYGEDRDFNVRYIERCASCKIQDYIGYNYRKNIAESLSTIKRGDLLKGDIEYWNSLYRLFDAKGFLGSKERDFLARRLYFFIVDYIIASKLTRSQSAFLKKNVDWRFLAENKRYIRSNKFVRYLVVHGKLGLLNLYFRIFA